MKISVIIGIYNCASTVCEALDSIISQTYKNFEIIICDDGSTDDSYIIAKKYCTLYPYIKLLKNDKNMGLGYTLNKCLKASDGEYIARMDGDDIALPTRFEKQVLFLDNNKDISFVSSAMIHFDQDGIFKIGNPKNFPLKNDFIRSSPFAHAPSMVRKTAFEFVGGYNTNSRCIRVEDYNLWFKMYSKGLKGANISEPLYKMRDDRNAYRRRKFKYRINEAYVKMKGFRMLQISPIYYFYIIRPLVIGILPYWLYKFLRN